MDASLKICCLLIIFLLLFACENERHEIYGTGTFEASEVLVSPQTAGLITEMPVSEGQAVRRGDLIAQIDIQKQTLTKEQLEAGIVEVNLNISLARQQIEAAEIQFQNIKKNYERFRNLLEEKSTSQQSVDDLQTKYEMAEKNLQSARIQYQSGLAKKQQLEAQLKLINQQIDDGSVRSPLDGIVLRKIRNQGEFAMIGAGLVEIADLSEMEIRIYISQHELGLVKTGDKLTISIDSHPGETFEGTITWISPKAEFTPKNVQTKEARANLVYAIKLSVQNPDGIFKIGMPADVYRD
ncbi:efflux RND transporter periplasmic adaptor subunit [candidate division KSB1 bacterium]|nr:efflux RND transporter periplasmic adaptor subunit [candidate division KSB1 bacterium]